MNDLLDTLRKRTPQPKLYWQSCHAVEHGGVAFDGYLGTGEFTLGLRGDDRATPPQPDDAAVWARILPLILRDDHAWSDVDVPDLALTLLAGWVELGGKGDYVCTISGVAVKAVLTGLILGALRWHRVRVAPVHSLHKSGEPGLLWSVDGWLIVQMGVADNSRTKPIQMALNMGPNEEDGR